MENITNLARVRICCLKLKTVIQHISLILKNLNTRYINPNTSIYIQIIYIIYIHVMYFKIIYFKELTHGIMNDGNSKICRVGWEAGDPKKKLMSQFKSESYMLRKFPLAEEIPSCSGKVNLLFYSGLKLIGWDPPNRSHSALLKVHLFKCLSQLTHSHRNIQSNV